MARGRFGQVQLLDRLAQAWSDNLRVMFQRFQVSNESAVELWPTGDRFGRSMALLRVKATVPSRQAGTPAGRGER